MKRIALWIVLLVVLVGCNQQSIDEEELTILLLNENSNEEMRESLVQCLDKEKIYSKIEDGSVWIKKDDVSLSTSRCS